MWSAILVAASFAYLFWVNDGVGHIAGWVGESVKPTVVR